VEEFDLKKEASETISTYEAKLSRATKDLTAASYEVNVRERFVVQAGNLHYWTAIDLRA
jgi:hypothetical protein